MPELIIAGIAVQFPFEPYQLQRNYMAKVLECLQNSTNGVLESPTGTGKTLCLLCATLAWICKQKAEFKASIDPNKLPPGGRHRDHRPHIDGIDGVDEAAASAAWSASPKVIYASRTHSQLTQAMQELKRSSYSHVKAAVIGSRDQLCIHPDVTKELGNANKIHMCKLKVVTRTCSFHHRVDAAKDAPQFRDAGVLDIEDLVAAGRKAKACPYFVSRELIPDADIVFMPYNYLLDPKARKANKVELANTIVILDEAHNVEKMCEDSASVQLASSEVATCIDDVTHILTAMQQNRSLVEDAKDFTEDDVVLLKEMLLSLEQVIDDITISNADDGETRPGAYIFEFLAQANITDANHSVLSSLLENLITFLTTVAESNTTFRRGAGFQKLQDLLLIVFGSTSDDYKERIGRCYKVHIEIEQPSKPRAGDRDGASKDGWLQPKAKQALSKKRPKLISYWCFSPGFGMQQLLGKQTRSVILTSGTLAPLKPLISELAIPIAVRLENPHIVTAAQVCVKVVTHGPDREPLISNYENRSNPKYLQSLGRTVLSFCPVVPHGLLIFFTSYMMLNKCRDTWQASGLWSEIRRHKPIFIEPKEKEAFVPTMNDYYAAIEDPVTRGAIFMAVCRGKVSEGLDFANANGRAVIITGLPFPPLMDPRIVLKKKYLQDNRTRDNEMLSGDDWYFLEATRAVNQAIGRVIRHKDDYGAILLCDLRFMQPRQKTNLSSWIQGHLSAAKAEGFGPLIGQVSRFFRNAERTLPQPGKLLPLNPDEQLKSGDCFRDDPAGTISYKFDNKPTPSQMPPIRNANEVIGHDPLDKYRRADSKTLSHSVFGSSSSSCASSSASSSSSSSSNTSDFLSRLDQQTTTIDFNSTAGLVSIHKRERTSPLFEASAATAGQHQQQLKKRRLRLVPDDQPPFGGSVASATNANAVPAGTTIADSGLPSDRITLLKMLKSSLAPAKYALFVSTLTAYQRDSDVDQLIAAFVQIFDQPQFHYLCRGMRRFVKESHKARFDAELDRLL